MALDDFVRLTDLTGPSPPPLGFVTKEHRTAGYAIMSFNCSQYAAESVRNFLVRTASADANSCGMCRRFRQKLCHKIISAPDLTFLAYLRLPEGNPLNL